MFRTATRDQVMAHCKDSFQYRAYMSSGLTNVPDGERDSLTSTLEHLFLDVFKPLGIFLYLPHLWSDPGHNAQISPEDVHILDRLRISESDFLVVCADYPSFGVGQEVEIAQSMGLQAIIFQRESSRVSRMLLGAPAFHVMAGGDSGLPSKTIIVYRDYDDLRRQLTGRTAELLSCLPPRESRPATPNFGRRLREVLKRERCSVEELAEKTGLTVAFIHHLTSQLETPYRVLQRWELPVFNVDLDLTKYTNPGLWVLRAISRALEIPIADLIEADVVSTTKAQEMEVRSRIQRAIREFSSRKKLTPQEHELLESQLEQHIELQAARSTGPDLEKAIERLWNRTKGRG